MSLELQDIFERFGVDYRKNHPLPLNQLKTMNAIESCRTSNLGGHIDVCDSCGHERISYNSCRNRHCPKCQGLAKEQWLLERERDLLNIGYFHVVFTVPDSLNPLALQNQKVFYSLLFKAASETLAELSRDPKYLGAEIGIISVLHTWGQNLMDHPHVHCIVPGGGLFFDGTRFVRLRFCPGNLEVSSWLSSRKPIKMAPLTFTGSSNLYPENLSFKVWLMLCIEKIGWFIARNLLKVLGMSYVI